jgi:hypothetical protein
MLNPGLLLRVIQIGHPCLRVWILCWTIFCDEGWQEIAYYSLNGRIAPTFFVLRP